LKWRTTKKQINGTMWVLYKPKLLSAMKKLVWLLGTFVYSTLVNAQNFEFVAGDTLVRTFYLNDYTTAHTAITNHADEAVIFQWELITFDHPLGWEFSLCDYPLCYTLGETTGTMNPAGPHSNHAFLSINVEAISVDTGFYQIKVWDQLLPELTDTLTVQMISEPSYAKIIEGEETIQPLVRIIGSELLIYNPLTENFNCTIYGLNGVICNEFILNSTSWQNISLSQFSKGIYFVEFKNYNEILPIIRFFY
jgi:hypothetical protein